ncbi:hypothetical protein B0T17DRAFT_646649 [Bombardia bombarda]|uniref:Uncharacterized protein n=1 Tax=Bombardia bombarda TaxID=252184 RepID=A0AA40BVH7_9PEZI|nr:hypothetical protein B0T17DRAFT_646649 [Bombardia bombarda]
MNECVEPPIRCGIPRDNDHDRDQIKLFLPNILLELKTGQTRVTSFFVRRSVYLAYFGLPSAEFVIDQQLTHHFDLRVHGAYPADRTGLGSEVHANTTAQQEEQLKLDQLKELSQIEQAKLDHLRELVREQQERLDQITVRVDDIANEQDPGQNQSMIRVAEENDQQLSGMELVPINTVGVLQETSLAADLETRSSTANASRPAKRVRRITRFDFDRVLEGSPSDKDNSMGSASSSSQPIRIDFVSREDTGKWVVCDAVLVNTSDSSPVQRTAAKYLRKQFCLFDTNFNNLIPRTCFEKVTANGTNTILVVPTSQVSIIRDDGTVSEQGGSRT